MSTPLDIISDSLTAIGQLGQGQTANPEDGALGLRQLNLILSQASTKRLMISFVSIRPYPLIGDQADYPLGPTAPPPYNVTRPTLIESAQINVPGSSVWLPITVADKPKWDAIPNRGAVDEIVTTVYPEYSYPNMIFRVHPKPSGTPTIRFGAWEPLAQFAALVEDVVLPDAYEEWLVSELAFKLAPYYDQPIPANLIQRRQEAVAAVMQINAQSLGGALSPAQQMSSPNVGNPIPQAPAGGPQ